MVVQYQKSMNGNWEKSIVRFPRSRRNVGCAGSDSSSRIITRTKEHGELLTVVEEKDISDKHGQTRCRHRIRQSCTAERGVKRAAVGRRRPQQFPFWYAVHFLRLPFLPRRLLAVAADKAKAPWRRPVLCRMSEVCHLRSARHPNAMTLIVPGRLKLKSVALIILIPSALTPSLCSTDAAGIFHASMSLRHMTFLPLT